MENIIKDEFDNVLKELEKERKVIKFSPEENYKINCRISKVMEDFDTKFNEMQIQSEISASQIILK